MIEPFCPNPVILQQLYTGPLRTSIDAFAHQLLHQGYARWTTKYTMRLLADLSSWLQRHTLLATDLNEQRMQAFLHDRYQRCRAHREDRAALRRLRAHLREQGVIPIPMVESD